MTVRVPIVPNFNDSPDEVKAIAHFVKTELGSVDIDLLPYNKLGESKYERLDKTPISLKEDEDNENMQILETAVRLEMAKG